MTITRTYTDVLGPEDSFTLQVDTLDSGDRALTLTITEPEPAAPLRPSLRIGMEGPAGDPTRAIVAAYPGLGSMREFGTKRSGESLPSLSAPGTSKEADMPATCEPWHSWKHWDVTRQAAWLASLPTDPAHAAYRPARRTTYHHEPHGDTGMTPTLYRSRGEQWAGQIASSSNAHLIASNGPVVTRYWLQEANGNPLDWWYDGADFYGLDPYEPAEWKGVPLSRPWTSAELFGPALDKLYAALPDWVEIGIAEMGRRMAPGQERADLLYADLEYLFTQHPRVRVVNDFNSSAFPDFAFSHTSPEAIAWRAAMADFGTS